MKPGHGRTLFLSLCAIAGMTGMVVASVPLYRLVCNLTGMGGATRIAAQAPTSILPQTVTVRFDASVARDVPWRFQPVERSAQVHLGEERLAVFHATNISDQPITGTATFNVTPDKAGRYFNKIQCFCFSQQTLAPGQSVDMPVSFFVDPALAQDPDAAEIGTITLSYTFFKDPAATGKGRS